MFLSLICLAKYTQHLREIYIKNSTIMKYGQFVTWHKNKTVTVFCSNPINVWTNGVVKKSNLIIHQL